MTSALVVINPISGAGRRHAGGAAEVELASGILGRAGYETSVIVTTGPGHATEAAGAAAARGAGLVVSWGGDGTMNEVARALAFGTTALALVPAGSGNGLGRELGVPFDPVRALEIAAGGRRRRIDVGEVNGEFFFNVAGVGLDASIARAFAERSGRRGRLRYARVGVEAVLGYRAQRIEVAWDGGASSPRALFVALANSRQYGSHGCIAPPASLDDGRLDLVIVEDQPLWRIATRLPAFFLGRLQPGTGVTMSTFTTAAIAAASGTDLHLDGEPRIIHGPLNVRVHPRALDVIVPPARP
ncbi:MAG: YegS/Rv2252/BmrU family lipid kinase [Acidobacteria bacterium]|nr:YegS/Rv2252/BmrU family lipid kinase [Acidobacteriota bacterium]